MINDVPGITPYARTVLLAALTVNTTIFLVCCSASLSADGAAAFLLAFSLYAAMSAAMLNFFIVIMLAFTPRSDKKPLNHSVKAISFALVILGFSNATLTTSGYVTIALQENRQQINACAIQLLRQQTLMDRLRYSIHTYFIAKDLKNMCGLRW